jgi:hypothetical protein
MTDPADKIGVVRQHRWVSADKQAEALKPRCRVVVSLSGGSLQQVDRADLEQLSRPGTVIECVHAFLLADPKRKHGRGGMQADFRLALERLERRGAKVVDVDGSICSGKHRKAMLALVDSDIARSNRGAKSATNGALSKGRPAYVPSKAELAAAKAIWRNVKDYPDWKAAQAGFDADVPGFSTARAFKLWRGRR